MRPHIVVVSHDATRTGAPKVAVEIARALRSPDRRVTTVLRAGGPLVDDFHQVSDRTVTEPGRIARVLLRRVRATRGLANRVEERIAGFMLDRLGPDLLYCNTVKSACYVRPARRRGIPVVLHVHEVGGLASSTLARYRLEDSYREISLVACSRAAARELAAITGVPEADIHVVPSAVDVDQVRALAQSDDREPTFDSSSSRDIVVGACGRANEGKGVDLWLQAAAALRGVAPELALRFVWVGQAGDDEPQRLARRLGVADVVTFVGEMPNPYVLLREVDIFTLPSRADAYPLVVLEVMALGRPVVAFDVGGVPDQLGDAGIVVPAGDVGAFTRALVSLCRDPTRRREIGRRASRRVETLLSLERMRLSVRQIADAALRDATTGSSVMPTAARPMPTRARKLSNGPGPRVFVLKYFDAKAAARAAEAEGGVGLPYRLETLANAVGSLDYSDAHLRDVWVRPAVRRLIRRIERLTAPLLQTLLATRRLAASDVVLAIFESQGNTLAMLRAVRLPGYSRPRFVVVACWLAMDLERFGALRRRLYRFAYRGVDQVIVFSRNQTAILSSQLGIEPEHVVFVPFGIDADFFNRAAVTPRDAASDPDDDAYVLAVGRDRGRDWRTFFAAVDGTGLRVRVAARPEDLDGLSIPANVEFFGVVDRLAYRDLLARARVVVVSTRPVAYPTGQSVILEALAMERCCVVTDTEPMRDYLSDGRNALLVPPGDADALRTTVVKAYEDPALRETLGRQGAQDVAERLNAPTMWATIGDLLKEDVRRGS